MLGQHYYSISLSFQIWCGKWNQNIYRIIMGNGLY
jgi:hypothetical protein